MSLEHTPSEVKSERTTTTRMAWRIEEFCAAIGISRSHFYAQLKQGNIRTIMIGNRRLVPDVERARLLGEEERY